MDIVSNSILHFATQYMFALRLSELATFNCYVKFKPRHMFNGSTSINKERTLSAESVLNLNCHRLLKAAAPACGTISSLHMLLRVLRFQSPNPSDQRKSRLANHHKKSQEEMYAVLAAEDRLLSHQIAHRNFIKDSQGKGSS